MLMSIVDALEMTDVQHQQAGRAVKLITLFIICFPVRCSADWRATSDCRECHSFEFARLFLRSYLRSGITEYLHGAAVLSRAVADPGEANRIGHQIPRFVAKENVGGDIFAVSK